MNINKVPDESAEHTHSELVTRGLSLKSIRLADRECDFVASTDAVDSYDEVVAQNWDLARFKANPVILYAHNSRELPVGKATRCEMVNGSLECTIKFASERANPRAEEVWCCVQEGVLRAVSVGFNPRDVRLEKRDGKDVYVLDDNELYEVSVVPVPANAEALAKMKQRAVVRAQSETPTMNLKELQDRAEAAEKLAEENGKLAATAQSESEKLKIANATLVADLATVREAHAKDLEKIATAEKSAAEAADALLVKEVDALVGVKFTPAERDAQLELARANKVLFNKLAGERPALTIIGASVLPKEADPIANTATEPGDGDGLAQEAKQLAANQPAGSAEPTPWG